MVDVKKVKQGRTNSFSQKNLGVEANIGLGLFDFFTIQTNNSLSSYVFNSFVLRVCVCGFFGKKYSEPQESISSLVLSLSRCCWYGFFRKWGNLNPTFFSSKAILLATLSVLDVWTAENVYDMRCSSPISKNFI